MRLEGTSTPFVLIYKKSLIKPDSDRILREAAVKFGLPVEIAGVEEN